IEGNYDFNDQEIILWSGISTGQVYYEGIIDSVKKNLAFNFALHGYFNSSFEGTSFQFSPDSQSIDISISVDEGKPSYINKIEFVNAENFDSTRIIPLFRFLYGEIVNSQNIENVISEALTIYENNGYPFVKIILSSIYLFND